jgi:organic hydroperoxide reductase OsmC/OhrA
MKKHNYTIKVKWTGNQGDGTLNYNSYSRNHTISAIQKYQNLQGSSDPSFLGDKSRYNPEELFLSSLSACHMLWYLHLCSTHNIVVTKYSDDATGVMEETENGSGKFVGVTLYPTVAITDKTKITLANTLHEEANKMCFIANSCNFDVAHKPNTMAE